MTGSRSACPYFIMKIRTFLHLGILVGGSSIAAAGTDAPGHPGTKIFPVEAVGTRI
jgi:hypothetical protein